MASITLSHLELIDILDVGKDAALPSLEESWDMFLMKRR